MVIPRGRGKYPGEQMSYVRGDGRYNPAVVSRPSGITTRHQHDCLDLILCSLYTGKRCQRVTDAQQTQSEQVCVQLPTSADNVTLPAFAAVRRAAARLLLGAGQQSIVHTGPTAANPQLRNAAGEWDRQTDRHRTVRWTLLRILCEQCQ